MRKVVNSFGRKLDVLSVSVSVSLSLFFLPFFFFTVFDCFIQDKISIAKPRVGKPQAVQARCRMRSPSRSPTTKLDTPTAILTAGSPASIRVQYLRWVHVSIPRARRQKKGPSVSRGSREACRTTFLDAMEHKYRTGSRMLPPFLRREGR
ncbi:uncharacterized protein LY79DRAFT_553155 [Colletotrichum navitas]|uniref:Transmembrane protein n=1 Tax=Colletotrichum navitas TaxID=681940 RepID=A0AAD8Q1J6_9PEZI|nr:uncharacterized protein LY79DRAFT_553155 [Colletotrichum navitas]KAK1593219.1 hypothetical protein LY79DRAFT_553155 [Colletotrichum navitas]